MMRDRGRTWLSPLAIVVVVGAASVGCARPTDRAATPAAVGTTRLTSAELDGADGAPRVGKSQWADEDASAASEQHKAEPRRNGRRPGGGFSGYK